jgi:hypothetical protein
MARFRIPTCVAILAALAALAAPAAAQSRTGVIARAVDRPPADETATVNALAAALEARDAAATVLRDPIAVARGRRSGGALERGRLDGFDQARQLIKDGWKAYLQVEPAFADSRLGEARRKLQDVLDLDGAMELMADASLRLGAVRLHMQRNDEASAAFALAATLDPTREVSAQDFAPEVVRAYLQVRDLAGGPGATLQVRSQNGASIEVDGVAAGTAPLSRQVSIGEHAVVARAPGKLAAAQLVKVSSNGTEVDIPLDDDLVGRALDGAAAALRPNADTATAAGAIAVTTTYAELDQIIIAVTTWSRGEPALVGQRCGGSPLRCTDAVEVGFPVGKLDAGARTFIEKLSGAPLVDNKEPSVLRDRRVREPVRPTDGKGGGRRPWYTNKWVWIGAGLVAVAGTAAAMVLSSGDEGGVGFDVGPCGFCP